jgi:hypothetical protein
MLVGKQFYLLLLNVQASSRRGLFTGTLNKATGCVFPCLQKVADALKGMAITMQIKSSTGQ